MFNKKSRQLGTKYYPASTRSPRLRKDEAGVSGEAGVLGTNQGFTLIELMIVAAIGVILLSIGFLSLRSFRIGQNLENNAETIFALLRAAQEKSISQEGDTRWGVYLDNQTSPRNFYYLYQVAEGMVGVEDMPALTINITRTLNSGIDFAEPTSGSTINIMFSRATGYPNTSTTVIIFAEQSGDQKVITVGSNGRVSY